MDDDGVYHEEEQLPEEDANAFNLQYHGQFETDDNIPHSNYSDGTIATGDSSRSSYTGSAFSSQYDPNQMNPLPLHNRSSGDYPGYQAQYYANEIFPSMGAGDGLSHRSQHGAADPHAELPTATAQQSAALAPEDPEFEELLLYRESLQRYRRRSGVCEECATAGDVIVGVLVGVAVLGFFICFGHLMDIRQ